MSSTPQPRFAADSDPAALETFLAPLLVANGGRWTLTMEGQALEREFKFKTFAKTWVSYTRTHTSLYPSLTAQHHAPFQRTYHFGPESLFSENIEREAVSANHHDDARTL